VSSVTDDEAAFVDEMGQYLGSYKFVPMSGRLWAWLLICEPAEQTAADLAAELQASRGAISPAVAFLAGAGMIRRSRRRGDRREYFSAPPGTFNSILRSAGAAYGRLVQITEGGLAAIAERPPAFRQRLVEVHDAASFLERDLPALIESYLRDREAHSASTSSSRTLSSVDVTRL
jgi:DNA-binding transcriptional regulator GbsR (MarR family)